MLCKLLCHFVRDYSKICNIYPQTFSKQIYDVYFSSAIWGLYRWINISFDRIFFKKIIVLTGFKGWLLLLAIAFNDPMQNLNFFFNKKGKRKKKTLLSLCPIRLYVVV